MKKNEYYRHKWNKYVVKIIDVRRTDVEMKTVSSGVVETISKENFDMNYELCTDIYKWKDTIEELFNFGKVSCMGPAVKVVVDDSWLEFSIGQYSDLLAVQFSDDIKEAVESEYNIMEFLVDDADEVIHMFADLFE